MAARWCSPAVVLKWVAPLLCLAIACPVFAADTTTVQSFRTQYDTMMSGFERILSAQGNTVALAQARRGREIMNSLTDDQITAVLGTKLPDLSPALSNIDFVAAKVEAKASAAPLPRSPGFPDPVPVVAGCNGVDTTAETRYALFITKEVANAVLAAAAWVCNEDILGENGSAACIPLAIAADVANGFFDTATFCAGELTANQVDANFNRLAHIHDDLAADTTSIINNDNANMTAIINNDNTNTSSIITNDNTNTTAIINNDNANTATIIANANANKNELRDLILRTQIEADMAMTDSAAVVALYEIPTARGGYLDLVQFIVTDTIAKVLAAGGTVGNAQQMLNDANAAKAAGHFKLAYATYRKAYKAAGKPY
jgi:hypothetical protein